MFKALENKRFETKRELEFEALDGIRALNARNEKFFYERFF